MMTSHPELIHGLHGLPRIHAMYSYDENLFRERWLGPPGVPGLQYLAVGHAVASGHHLKICIRC